MVFSRKFTARAVLVFSMVAAPLMAQTSNEPAPAAVTQDTAKVELAYGAHGEHTVTLAVRSKEAIESLVRRTAATGKAGEALVADIIAADAKNIISITRRTLGKKNDGPAGQPGLQRWNELGWLVENVHFINDLCNDAANGDAGDMVWNDQGQLTEMAFCQNGKLNDGPNGEPANRSWNDQGQLIEAVRYQNDMMNDAPDGDAAWKVWNGQGQLIRVTRWKNDKLNDGANGEPAWLEWNDLGQLVRVMRYQEGRLIKKFTPEEISEYLATRDGHDVTPQVKKPALLQKEMKL